MKKKLFYLFALVCSMSLFTACSDDDDDVKVNTDLNTTYTSADAINQLVLTYGGEVMLGKKVSFDTTDGMNATIVLEGADISLTRSDMSAGLVNPGVIPGESKVAFSVILQPVANGYTFEGEHTTDNYTMKYKGAVEKGKLNLGLNVELLGDNTLVGSVWSLAPYNPWGDKSTPLHVVWESSKSFSVVVFPGTPATDMQPGDLISMIGAVSMIPVGDKGQKNLNEVLSYLLKSVTFMKDGNIVASYSEMDDMAAPSFKDSPLNMVQYAVKNGKLYLYLNVEAIMAVAAQADTKALDIETILPTILPKLLELIPMISNGIPLGYSIEEGALKVYIDNELGLKIVDILLPLLENEEIVAAIKEAVASNPDFAFFIGVVEAVLEQAPEVFSKTTKMEIGLNFVKPDAE